VIKALSGTLRTAIAAAAILAGPGNRAAHCQAPSLLHPIFRDHTVLQRDRPVAVWGRAAPGEEVTVALAGASATARADASGRWTATLPPLPAGGPHTLVASTASGARATAGDVLIGDVFLCSGQSNMVLEVRRTLDSRAEVANSANDSIRMLAVPLVASPTPIDTFRTLVGWQVAAPATTPDWSAACFYFARELQKTIHVPIGLVNASWGGSNIRPWMSEAALHAAGDYEAGLEVLRLYATDPAAAARRFGAVWEEWWRGRAPVGGGAEPWSTGPIREGDWGTTPATLGFWERWGVSELASFNGMVWYRTTVRLSAAQAAMGAVLSLGPIDEIDQTWVNGLPVGYTSDWSADRLYELPAGTLHEGENVVVVNVLDTYGTGGLYGPAEKRALRLRNGEVIPLDGVWRYQVVQQPVGSQPRAPWEATGGLSTLYNAMIAPIGPYGFRGVVWYQGESNTGQAERYQALLAGLMADWRGRFGADLPFLVVQLANYGAAPTTPVESGWAQVREAQRRAVAADAHAGLAVTIDIGDRYDIHPPNKQELGRRLARAARHVVYGEAIAPSGPVPLGARRQGGDVVVTFGDVERELVAYSAAGPIGFELCGTAQGSCRFATARIEGTRVLLEVAARTAPTRVRYCWADSPVCTLFDGAGLSAGPFEVPVGPETGGRPVR
jgi:sialate O-acetylesterase